MKAIGERNRNCFPRDVLNTTDWTIFLYIPSIHCWLQARAAACVSVYSAASVWMDVSSHASVWHSMHDGDDDDLSQTLKYISNAHRPLGWMDDILYILATPKTLSVQSKSFLAHCSSIYIFRYIPTGTECNDRYSGSRTKQLYVIVVGKSCEQRQHVRLCASEKGRGHTIAHTNARLTSKTAERQLLWPARMRWKMRREATELHITVDFRNILWEWYAMWIENNHFNWIFAM